MAVAGFLYTAGPPALMYRGTGTQSLRARVFDFPMLNLHTYSRLTLGALLAASCCAANAHFFVQSYSLPVPFSLYATGAGAALILSFVVVALLARNSSVGAATVVDNDRPKHASALTGSPNVLGRAIALSALVSCVVSGFFGSSDAFRNINMTLFWVVFVLGVPYSVAVFGDYYASINPWETIVVLAEKLSSSHWTGHLPYPNWLGTFPALAFYMALIGLELFAQLRPFGLAVALTCYTVAMVLGAWLFGKKVWIEKAEVFGQLFRLLGLMSFRAAPVQRIAGVRTRVPFIGVLRFQPGDWGAVLFIMFMLSSTAFDGFHATVPWADTYWKGIYPQIAWIDRFVGPRGGNHYAASTQLYHVWQWLCLALSPVLYLGVFVVFVWASRVVTRSAHSLRTLVFQFAPSLLPIALVYHISHYYTLVLWQGPQLFKLISDPLGLGWNLFGTARINVPPITVDIGTIWHTQVFLIVFGHIASVLIAHLEALNAFRSPLMATVSQAPMLILMMFFTASGLWILSLPISGS